MSAHLPIVPMPLTRGECASVPRPCPHRSCRHHLEPEPDRQLGMFEVAAAGPARPSCSLDVADEHPDGLTIEQLAEVLGASRESTRREAEAALEELRSRIDPEQAAELLDALGG